jgi:flagellar biosynthesis protein
MPRTKEGEQRAMAVALKYAPGTAAPTVVAKGRGLIAEEIISRARENGIFVHESPELVALLSQVDLDGQIPPQLYVAVAELLAWIYRIEREGALPEGLPPGNLG